MLFLRGKAASAGGSVVKSPPAVQEARGPPLGREDPLEKGMATHSSILGQENSTDRGAWWATLPGIAKSRTQLSRHADKGCKRTDPSESPVDLVKAW